MGLFTDVVGSDEFIYICLFRYFVLAWLCVVFCVFSMIVDAFILGFTDCVPIDLGVLGGVRVCFGLSVSFVVYDFVIVLQCYFVR